MGLGFDALVGVLLALAGAGCPCALWAFAKELVATIGVSFSGHWTKPKRVLGRN